ncbi:MAG: SagB/ThcOx family dehydrogenase [Gammaproteobacteria bacterium]
MTGRGRYRSRLARVLVLLVSVLGGQLWQLEGKAMSEGSIGERFHRETALSGKSSLGELWRFKPRQPPPDEAHLDTQTIDLPPPDQQGLPVETAIKNRRSVRHYSPKPLPLGALSQLLFAAQGTTGHMYGEPLRAAPSAGALYPFEIYVVAHNVEALARGLYHFAPNTHQLELIRAGDLRSLITQVALQQAVVGEADAIFVLAAVFDRTRRKYGERGFRYVYIEAGHISQNIYLQAVSLGLGSVAVGAFLDEGLNRLLGIDGQSQAAIYLHAVGTL